MSNLNSLRGIQQPRRLPMHELAFEWTRLLRLSEPAGLGVLHCPENAAVNNQLADLTHATESQTSHI